MYHSQTNGVRWRHGNYTFHECPLLMDNPNGTIVRPLYCTVSKAHLIIQTVEFPDECLFCLDSLGETSFYRRLPCSHIFHLSCIDEWFCEEDASCPLCRQKFYSLRGPRFVYLQPPSMEKVSYDDRIHPLELCSAVTQFLKRRIQGRSGVAADGQCGWWQTTNQWFWLYTLCNLKIDPYYHIFMLRLWDKMLSTSHRNLGNEQVNEDQ